MKFRVFLYSAVAALSMTMVGCSSSSNGDGGSTTASSDGGTTSGTATGATDSGTTSGTATGVTSSGTTSGTATGVTEGGTAGGTGTGTTTSSTDGSTTSSTGGEGSGGDLGAIAGFWDVTEVIDGLQDVFYVEIFADGNITSWDYDGDEYDGGENCYFSFSFTGQNLGGNQYNLGGENVTATVSGGVLTVTDSDGPLQYPAITAFTSAALNDCI